MEPRVEWLACTKEVGEQGTPHLQGNIYFHNRITLLSIKKLFLEVSEKLNGVHIGDATGRPCHGNVGHNIAYVTKTGVELYEWGTRPALSSDGGEGDRWKHIRELARNGQISSIEEQYFDVYLRYGSKLRAMYKPNPLSTPCEVIWVMGPSRSGKDYYIYKTYENMYIQMGLKWFDDYDGEDTVYIAEIDSGKAKAMGIQLLKLLCDWTPVRVEVKGASYTIRPKRVVFSSNYTFDQVFSDFPEQDSTAMWNRITQYMFKECKEKDLVPVGRDFYF